MVKVTRRATGAALVEDVQVSHDVFVYTRQSRRKRTGKKKKKGGSRIESGLGNRGFVCRARTDRIGQDRGKIGMLGINHLAMGKLAASVSRVVSRTHDAPGDGE